jgi:hypothetical protein
LLERHLVFYIFEVEGCLDFASLRLPLSIDKTTEISTAGEEPKILEMAE